MIVRDPASDHESVREYWVFSVVGHRGTYNALEHQNTWEGLRAVTETRWTGSDAELRICRIGATVILVERPIGSPTWLFAQEYGRPDLSLTLEAGLVAYSWTDEFDMRASFDRFELVPIGSYSECFDD